MPTPRETILAAYNLSDEIRHVCPQMFCSRPPLQAVSTQPPARSSLSSQSQEMTSHNPKRHFVSHLTAALPTSRAHLLVVVLANLFDEVDGCFGRTDGFLQSEVWQGAKAVDSAV